MTRVAFPAPLTNISNRSARAPLETRVTLGWFVCECACACLPHGSSLKPIDAVEISARSWRVEGIATYAKRHGHAGKWALRTRESWRQRPSAPLMGGMAIACKTTRTRGAARRARAALPRLRAGAKHARRPWPRPALRTRPPTCRAAHFSVASPTPAAAAARTSRSYGGYSWERSRENSLVRHAFYCTNQF